MVLPLARVVLGRLRMRRTLRGAHGRLGRGPRGRRRDAHWLHVEIVVKSTESDPCAANGACRRRRALRRDDGDRLTLGAAPAAPPDAANAAKPDPDPSENPCPKTKAGACGGRRQGGIGAPHSASLGVRDLPGPEPARNVRLGEDLRHRPVATL